MLLSDKSHPARGAWIEIRNYISEALYRKKSHPARGAWIEMRFCARMDGVEEVAPRKGCVD